MSTTVTYFRVRIDKGVSDRGYYLLNALFFEVRILQWTELSHGRVGDHAS
jgi:hypothetical protein